MPEKVIFLDIDNVLAATNEMIRLRMEGTLPNIKHFDPRTVSCLREVAEAHQASPVISSTWRGSAKYRSLITWYATQAGWPNPPIIDRTIDLESELWRPAAAPPRKERTAIYHKLKPWDRGIEVEAWLAKYPVGHYAIVDDWVAPFLPFQKPFIVERDPHLNKGFTKREAEVLDGILNRPPQTS